MAVDYGWWLQYALWSLDDAVLLLYGIAPKSKRATFLKKSLGSRTEPRGKRDRERSMRRITRHRWQSTRKIYPTSSITEALSHTFFCSGRRARAFQCPKD